MFRVFLGSSRFVSLATAAHQGWSANLFTLASDMFPKRAVRIGSGDRRIWRRNRRSALSPAFTGFVLQFTHSYLPLFIIAGSAYLIALLVIQLLSPRLQPVNLEDIEAAV